MTDKDKREALTTLIAILVFAYRRRFTSRSEAANRIVEICEESLREFADMLAWSKWATTYRR